MASPLLRWLPLAAALAVGCSDDAGSGDATTGNDSTGATTMGPPATAGDDAPPATMSAGDEASSSDTEATTTAPGDDSSGATEGTAGSTSDSGSGSDGASGSSDSGDGSSGSSDDGTALPECEMCGEGEVCVLYQSFMTTYECHPVPAECAGDVDCDCGASLCTEPFIGCSDAPQPDTLFCACLAC